ncbi:MAG: hypothetical protein VW801_06355, partial [Candidatus Puniceispirillum sp.]
TVTAQKLLYLAVGMDFALKTFPIVCMHFSHPYTSVFSPRPAARQRCLYFAPPQLLWAMNAPYARRVKTHNHMKNNYIF